MGIKRAAHPQTSSPSSRRAWIEISRIAYYTDKDGSPSSRRAWIEIKPETFKKSDFNVALLAEGVDRNRVPAKS